MTILFFSLIAVGLVVFVYCVFIRKPSTAEMNTRRESHKKVPPRFSQPEENNLENESVIVAPQNMMEKEAALLDEIVSASKSSEQVNIESHPIESPEDAQLLDTSETTDEKIAQEKTTVRQSISLYLVAPEGSSYNGYELLQTLLSVGLRYGKQCIFHRYTQKESQDNVLFHCASASAPGTFDLSKMGIFSTEGLCFFFSSDEVENPVQAFDCLLETIDQLVEDLGGQVLDHTQNLLTQAHMLEYRRNLSALSPAKKEVVSAA